MVKTFLDSIEKDAISNLHQSVGKSKKVKNLFYTGQLTVPGPGVPPSLISGKLVSEQILNFFKS